MFCYPSHLKQKHVIMNKKYRMDDKMNTPCNVKIKSNVGNKIKQGYPLILKDNVLNIEVLQQEGMIIHLLNEQDDYIATAYYGEQNKGIGWVLSLNEKEPIDQNFFERKIQSAIKARHSFYTDKHTTAFRIFNGEGDGVGGISIDYYDGYYMVQWYSKGIYEFRDYVYEALMYAPNYKGIYEKKRYNHQGQYVKQDDFVQGNEAEFPIVVKENDMNYAIDLNDGAMTGIFLDQRNVRRSLREKYAYNRVILNTFSYTGAFAIAALHGGAQKTINVDLAKRSLDKTINQLQVNHFNSSKEEIRVMDVFRYFKYAQRHQLTYDVVILDPPSFARTKKKVTFSTTKDYPYLIKQAISITKQNGIIVASTNNASFGMKKFKKMIQDGFKDTKAQPQIIEEQQLPQDFKTNINYPEFDYLKVLFIRVT